MKKLTLDNFDKEILSSPVCIVDFYSPYCGPCKTVAPYFETWSEVFTNIDFFKCDVSEERELAQRLGITSVPTFKFFQDGKPIKTQVGLLGISQLEGLIRPFNE